MPPSSRYDFFWVSSGPGNHSRTLYTRPGIEVRAGVSAGVWVVVGVGVKVGVGVDSPVDIRPRGLKSSSLR